MKLNAMTSEVWAEWILRVTALEKATPALTVSVDTLPLDVITFYHGLPSQSVKVAFSQGLVLAIESFQPEPISSRQLFYLLHICGGITPVRAKTSLLRRLHDGTLQGQTYQNQNLQALLLSVLCQYDIGDQLSSYLSSLPATSESFSAFILGVRQIGQVGPRLAITFLERLVMLAKTDAELKQVANVIRQAFTDYGYKPLYDYWKSVASSKSEQIQSQASKINTLLAEHVLPWDQIDQLSCDQYGVLLAAEVFVRRGGNPLGPDLIRIADIARSLNDEIVRDALARIRHTIVARGTVRDPIAPWLVTEAIALQFMQRITTGRYFLIDSQGGVLTIPEEKMHVIPLLQLVRIDDDISSHDHILEVSQ